MAEALKRHGLEKAENKRLVCLIDPENNVSRRVAEKIGMRLEKEVRIVTEVGEEARAALKAAAGKFDEAKLKKAREMITAGQKLLNVVRIGNGVHNKKYSIMILDEAIANFEDTIDLLSTGG